MTSSKLICMTRPRKSTAEKKLTGTFRSDRQDQVNQDKNEQLIVLTNFQEGTKIEAPSEITDSFVRSYVSAN